MAVALAGQQIEKAIEQLMPDDEQLEVAANSSAAPKARKRVRLLLIAGLAVALVSAAAVYALDLFGHSKQSTEKAEKVEVVSPPLYLALDPPFIVNFENQGELRFLQISASVMTHDTKAVDAVTYHMPKIRNGLILLLADQKYESISDAAGKEKLREAMLRDIRKTMTEATGQAGIEAVYFTSFVMQ